MRALVISGGGSKGAFAGGVAQYLIEEMKYEYDIFVGTSTGSLLISHLALGEVEKIKKSFTSVNQDSIFSKHPFIIKNGKHFGKEIKINHLGVLRQFIKGKKTFGESGHLRDLIRKTLTKKEFEELKNSKKEIIVTVSNLSLNSIEYKSIKDFDYDNFCDWIWISCNFIPFMSVVEKNHYEYADGGFGSMVPVEEAIKRGADTVDVIVLETECVDLNRLPSRNAFSLLTNVHLYMSERIARQNIRIGQLVAAQNDVSLNFYYTPNDLTLDSLIFDSKLMSHWWETGREYAASRMQDSGEFRSW